jgi:hypothetical protein
MLALEVSFLGLALMGLGLGGWSICWARAHPHAERAWWGRRLFVLNLVSLGVTGLAAAFAHADGLVSLGLLTGLLLVGMLWESPSYREGVRAR